jgi:predicted DNA-binding protein YlxM (UPF0122 family)
MPKYDSLRKLERNKLLYEYYLAHPDYSLQEIGDTFKISKQRVWEIIQNMKKREGDKKDEATEAVSAA